MSNILFLIEFAALFGGVLLFCLWQLRSLDRLDREEEKKSGQDTNRSIDSS